MTEQVGEYTILATLSRDTYSIVYRGRQRTTQQPVVIRVWPTARAVSDEQQQSIYQECQRLIQLEDPCILPMLEVSVGDAQVSLVSEYAEHGSLYTRISQNAASRLPLEQALGIIKQVAQALFTAHQHTIVHGDLTPKSILFTSPESVALAHFQIASVLATITGYVEDSSLLRYYSAPERFRGTISEKTDQYALGCIAYELLTGQVPFSGAAYATLRRKHSDEEPEKLTKINPAIPADVEQAVLKTLAKQPEERYVDMQAFLQALDEAEAQRPMLLSSTPQARETQALAQMAPAHEQLTMPRTPALAGLKVSGQRPKPKTKRVQHMLLVLIALAVVVVSVYFMLLATRSGQRIHLQQGANRALSMTTTPTRQTSNVPTTTQILARETASPTLTQEPTTVQPASTPYPPATPVRKSSPVVAPPATQQPAPPKQEPPAPQPSPTPAAPQVPVRPVLDCIIPQDGNSFIAKFGYMNPNTFPASIPIGNRNMLYPSSLNGAQPTVFSPGYQKDAFQISSTGGSIIWILDGGVATAGMQDRVCP